MKEPRRVIHQNIGRLMSPEDQKKYGFKTMEQEASEQEYKLEREMHNQFILFLYRRELGFYHADPTRKSTIAKGMPDFGVFRDSRIIWIEFKIGKNKLSSEQHDRIATMLADGNTVCVCYEYPVAINAVLTFFGIKE